MFHNTTSDLQDQDRFFLSQTGLVLRPTVSDHITDENKTSLADVIMIQLTLTLLDIDATQYRTSLNVRSDRRDNWPFIKRWQAVKMTKKCEDVTVNDRVCLSLHFALLRFESLQLMNWNERAPLIIIIIIIIIINNVLI